MEIKGGPLLLLPVQDTFLSRHLPSPEGDRGGTNGRLRLRKGAGVQRGSGGGASRGVRTLFPGPPGPIAAGAPGLPFGCLLPARKGGVPTPPHPHLRGHSGRKAGRRPASLEPRLQPGAGCGPSARGRRGRAAADRMAAGLEQRLGSLAVFTRDDFEGDWRRVAKGGFGQVFGCSTSTGGPSTPSRASPPPPPRLQSEAARYLPALPRSVQRGRPEAPGSSPRGWGA